MFPTAQLDFAIANTHGKGRLCVDRRAVGDRAITEAETGIMPGAVDNPFLDRSFVQGATQMRTGRGDSIDSTALLIKHRRNTTCVHPYRLAGEQVLLIHHRYEIV